MRITSTFTFRLSAILYGRDKMAKRVVTSLATGAVYKWGIDVDFTGQFDPGTYQQVDLLDTAVLVAGIPKYYNKVSAGLLVEMTALEKTAALAEWEDYKSSLYNGSPQILAKFQTQAQLPIPPGEKGYLVGVVNLNGTGPGLAISTNTGWVLFEQSGMI